MPDEIIGTSPEIVKFRKQLPILARDHSPLILTGEEGVGKSFLASHIHATGPHGSALIETLNFSILSGRDQRIELLGAEPPELTTSKRSVLERKTTVVLKHVDNANGFLQDSLAAALSTAGIVRLGATEALPVLARVIFTFRRTIVQLEKSKALTPKLYQFLGLLKNIYIPPLRKRRDDIQHLARDCALKLYKQHQESGGVSIRGIAPDGTVDEDLLKILEGHRWVGNVRELLAFIRTLALFPLAVELREPEKVEVFKMVRMIEAGEEFSLPSGLANIERALVGRATHGSHLCKTGVARLLGISERALGRRICGRPRPAPLLVESAPVNATRGTDIPVGQNRTDKPAIKIGG